MSLNARTYNNKEMLLFPACIGNYLSKDHLAWIIDDVCDELDLRCLYNKVSAVGNPSYHPKMMLKILFYAYTQKTFSSRKIHGRVETDVAFIFLSGMQKPDFRTISDFRKNNLKELSELFIQIVRLCKKLGMVELGHISIDSTVIKANASKEQFYTRDSLDKEEQAIKQKMDELLRRAQDTDDEEDRKFGPDNPGDGVPEEIRDRKARLDKIKTAKRALKKPQKEINLTDRDASLQKARRGIIPGYRAQIAVDNKEQVIVAADVTNAADTSQLNPLVDQTLENTQKADDEATTVVTADSAYNSMKNLRKLKKKSSIDPYIPDNKYEAKKRNKKTDEASSFHKNNFRYRPDKNIYLCPNNRELRFIGKETDYKSRKLSFYRCFSCQECIHFGVCTKSPKGRAIKVFEDIHLIHNMRRKLDTEQGKSIYKKRQAIVEPVFGNIKHNLGFREFLLRGSTKIKAEFSLIAIAHNLLKIAKFVKKQPLLALKDKYLVPVPI